MMTTAATSWKREKESFFISNVANNTFAHGMALRGE